MGKKKADKNAEPETVEETAEETETAEKTETAIEPAGETALSTEHAPVPDGFDDFDDDDLILPRYAIVQPTSSYEDGEPGKFRNNLDGSHRETIRCVLLTYSKGMVRWSEKQGEDPLCRSSDALVPDRDIDEPPSDQCHRVAGRKRVPVCEHAKFVGGQPPACKKTYNFVGLDLEVDEGEEEKAFFFTVHGTGIRPTKAMLTKFFQSRTDLYGMSMTLGLSRTSNAKGTFYVITFSDYEPITPEQHAKFKALYNEMRDVDLRKSVEANEKAEGGDGYDPEMF